MSDFLTDNEVSRARETTAKRRLMRVYKRSNIGSIIDIPGSDCITPITTAPGSCVHSTKAMEVVRPTISVDPIPRDLTILVPILLSPSKSSNIQMPHTDTSQPSLVNSIVTQATAIPPNKDTADDHDIPNARPIKIKLSLTMPVETKTRDESFNDARTIKSTYSSPWSSPHMRNMSQMATPNNISKMKMAVKKVIDQNNSKPVINQRSRSMTSDDALAYENFVRARIREQFPDGIADAQVDKSQSDLTAVNMYTQAIKPVLVDRLPLESLVGQHFDLRKKRSRLEFAARQPEVDLRGLEKPEVPRQESTLDKIYSAMIGVNSYPRLLGVSALTFLVECAIRDGNLLLGRL